MTTADEAQIDKYECVYVILRELTAHVLLSPVFELHVQEHINKVSKLFPVQR